MTVAKQNNSSFKLYRRLLSYSKPYWQAFVLAAITMSLSAVVEPIFPAMLQKMLDNGFTNNKGSYDWLLYPALLLLAFLARALLTFVSDYLMAWVANNVVMSMRREMFSKMLDLPTAYYSNTLSGDLIARITNNVSNVTTAATSVITTVIRDGCTVLALVAWLFYLNWRLTLFTFIIVPFIGAAVGFFSQRLRKVSRNVQSAQGEMTQIVQEAIVGQKIIKLYGGREYESQRFYLAIQNLRRSIMRAKVAGSMQGPIVQFFSALAISSLMASALYQVGTNQTTVGGFVSFITAVALIMSPIKRLTDVNAPLQAGLVAAENVFDLLDQQTEIDLGKDTLNIANINEVNINLKQEQITNIAVTQNPPSPLIEFRQVCFSYQGTAENALNDLNFSVTQGECIGIVGSSGSGKTTIAHLLPRFYPISSGEILINNHPINQISLSSLRKAIAFVGQEVILFNDSIAANIAYGIDSEQQDFAAIYQAAKNAHALEFIEALPDGFATLIGENGVKLSGGQRQRIAIARALLKDAPILILDEATSALDSQSEKHVQSALNTLMRGRTSLIIAHRLSTIEKADRIVVLQTGKIAEVGSHQQLMELGGIYAQLVQLQQNDHTST